MKKGAFLGKGTTLLWVSLAFILAASPPFFVPESSGIDNIVALVFVLAFIYFIPFLLAVLLALYFARKTVESQHSQKLVSKEENKKASTKRIRNLFILALGLQLAYAVVGTALPIVTWSWVDEADWALQQKEWELEEEQRGTAVKMEIPQFTFVKPPGLHPPSSIKNTNPTDFLTMNRSYDDEIVISWATSGESPREGRSLPSGYYALWDTEFKAETLEEAAEIFVKATEAKWAEEAEDSQNVQKVAKKTLSRTKVAGFPAIKVEILSTKDKEGDDITYLQGVIFRRANILYSVSISEKIAVKWNIDVQVVPSRETIKEILNSFKGKH